MGDFEEAFKIKAEELLKLLSSVDSNATPESLSQVRNLFEKAKRDFMDGFSEEALFGVVQAIQKLKRH